MKRRYASFGSVRTFFFSSRRRHTTLDGVTEVQTCALPMLSPHKTNEPFLGAELERYRATVLRLLPSAAVQPTIEEESVDPIPVNRWRSHRFVVSWSAGAERIRRSVTFLNVSPEQQI